MAIAVDGSVLKLLVFANRVIEWLFVIRLFILYVDESIQNSHALIIAFIISWANAKQ